MSSSCTVSSHTCNIFPTRNIVSIVLGGSLSSTVSISISGMNNPNSASSSSLSKLKLSAYKDRTTVYNYLPTINNFDIVGSSG